MLRETVLQTSRSLHRRSHGAWQKLARRTELHRSPLTGRRQAHPLYTLHGVFEPTTMAIAITRSIRQEKSAYAATYRAAMARVDAGQISEEEATAHLHKQKELEHYFRLRAHERAHYYQHLSTSSGIAQAMLYNDRLIHVVEALRRIDQRIQIRIPLGEWVEAPAAVAWAVDYWRETGRLNRILLGDDGSASERRDEDLSAFRALFGSLRKHEVGPAFTFGYRTLAEGAAIATEWLYSLCQDPSRSSFAHADIMSSPPEYHLAYRYVADACPGLDVRSYLQTVCVLADMALHAPVDVAAWPLHGFRGPRPFHADPVLAPGVRFVRLIAAMAKRPVVDWQDKFAVGEFFMSQMRELDWPTPEEITRNVIDLVDESLALPRTQKLVDLIGDQHMMLRMHRALETPQHYPLAFIAPIDHKPINAANIAPTGIFGSQIDPPPQHDIYLRATQTY